MLLVEQEVVQPTLGLLLVTLHLWTAAFNQGSWGGDFAMGNHAGGTRKGYGGGGWNCHCYYNESRPTGAPFMGTMGVNSTVRHCWIRWVAGEFLMHMVAGATVTSYRERCCGQGGTGGSGVVKISHM